MSSNPSTVSRMLGWLTAGYPDGVPALDRFPLLAILRGRLDEDDLRKIMSLLVESPSAADTGRITDEEIAAGIEQVIKEPPTDAEIGRVSARLAAAGWPLEGLD